MKQKKSTRGEKQPQHSKSSSGTFKVIPTSYFVEEATNLKRKYPNIKNDFYTLLKKLQVDPITGNDYVGHDCYKVRMRLSDKKTGERDGARVIIKVVIIDNTVYVLSVYDKSDKTNFSDDEFDKMLKSYLEKKAELLK